MGQHHMNHLGNNGIPSGAPDLNMDFFFNSPDRFYRDIINESPIVNKTLHSSGGKTPLRNLNVNFSTPVFLRNIETSNSNVKSFTPLKNQIFNLNNSFSNTSTSNLEIFQTPNDKTLNSTLNSSPTTIKMNSSAIKDEQIRNKNDDKDNTDTNKILSMSPTPASKVQQNSHIIPNITNNLISSSVPKMGYFKKGSPVQEKKSSKIPKQPIITTHALVNHKTSNNTKFQIIMTDVNSFASSQTKGRRKKKLTRSATQVNTNLNGGTSKMKDNNVSKKQTLKRSVSQPSSVMSKPKDPHQKQNLSPVIQPVLPQALTESPPQQQSLQQHPLQEQSQHQRNIHRLQPQQIKQLDHMRSLNNQSFMQVEDFFEETPLPDQENVNWG